MGRHWLTSPRVAGEQMRLPEAWHDWRPADPRVNAAAEISRLTAAGYGATAVARSLNSRGIPTPTGRGRWHPETVRRHADPITRRRWAAYMRRYRDRDRDRLRGS